MPGHMLLAVSVRNLVGSTPGDEGHSPVELGKDSLECTLELWDKWQQQWPRWRQLLDRQFQVRPKGQAWESSALPRSWLHTWVSLGGNG